MPGIVAMLSTMLLGLGALVSLPSSAHAAEVNVVKSIEMKNLYNKDGATKTKLWDTFRVNFTVDTTGTGAKAGDTFTVKLPDSLRTNVTSFPMYAKDGKTEVAKCEVPGGDGQTLTCTFGDYITSHPDMTGGGWVQAAVQALAGVGVLAHGLDDDLVVILEVVQLDAAVHEHGDGVERLAVQHDLGHLVGDQVKEGGGTGLGVERDLGGGCEILGTDGQIKRNPVVDGRRDDGLALPGFDPGEICSWHCVPFWLARVVASVVRRTPDMGARGGLVNRRGQWLSYSLESSVAAMSATTGTIIGLRCS